MPASDTHMVQPVTKVLIVERDPEFANELADAFTRASFAVCRASDGPAALEEITWQLPHLIVLDLDLPPLPAAGGRLLEALRRQPITQSVPLLALATLSYREAREALRAGADDCLIKPLPPDEVVAAARDLLARTGVATHR